MDWKRQIVVKQSHYDAQLSPTSKNIVAAIGDSNEHLYLALTNGQTLVYDSALHGFQPQIEPILLDSKPVKSLSSLDRKGDQVLVCSEGHIGSGAQSPLKVLKSTIAHRPDKELPNKKDKLLAVGSVFDGAELFFGNTQSVTPWFLNLNSKADISSGSGLLRLNPSSAAKFESESLTRIQDEKIVGPLLALDLNKNLFVRQSTSWEKLHAFPCLRTSSGVGCTFFESGGFHRLKLPGPAVESWWPAAASHFTSEVQSVGPYQFGGEVGILAGHDEGVSWYSTTKRTWELLYSAGDRFRNRHSESSAWRFIGLQENGQASSSIWGVKPQSNDLIAVQFKNGMINPHLISEVQSVAGGGDRLFVLRKNGELLELEGKEERVLIPSAPTEASTDFVRLAALEDELLALGSNGKLYSTRAGEAVFAQVRNTGYEIVDLETIGGVPYLASKNGSLSSRPIAKWLKHTVRANKLQRVSHSGANHLTGLNTEIQALYTLRESGDETACGGWTEGSDIGEVKCVAGIGKGIIIGGELGSSYRDPENKSFVSIGKTAVDRYEIIGESIIAWNGERPLRLGDNGFEPFMNGRFELFMGHGGIWAHDLDAKSSRIIAPGGVESFAYSADLFKEPPFCFALSDSSVLLPSKNGGLGEG